MGRRRGHSRKRRNFFGDWTTDHYDSDGRKVGESRDTKDFWGDPKTDHFDADGGRTGESRPTSDWWGEAKTDHYDSDGARAGESRGARDFWGDRRTDHYDPNGSKVGESRAARDFWGDRRVDHFGGGIPGYDSNSRTPQSETPSIHDGVSPVHSERNTSYSGSSGRSYSSDSWSSSTESESDWQSVFVVLVVLVLVIGLVIWMFSSAVHPIAETLRGYKPTTLPTGVTSGPSGTSFYTGDGDPLAFQAYNDGDYFLKQSKYDQAIPYFAEAIRREPRYWYAYVSRADAYRFLGQNDLAVHDYDEAVRLRPNNPQGYLGRGMIEDRMGHCQEAINDINHALSLNPTELRDVYYHVRGLAYFNCGQYSSAIEDFNETLRLKPNDSASMGNRGAAYGRSGENERALEDYNHALKLDPTNAWLYLGRGVTYEHLSQYEHAIRDYDEAIGLNPNFTEAYTARQDATARMSATTANENATPATSDSVVTNTDGEGASAFNDNFNTRLWFVTVVPTGVGTISETNQQFEMTKISSGNGYIGLASKCKVSGDFDVQVDYKLLNWPAQNSHTVRLMTPDLPDGGTGFPGVYRNSSDNENYQFRNQLGTVGLVSVPTSDSSGTIGLRRKDSTLSGYGPHGTIGSAPAPTGPTGFTIDFATSSTTAPGNVTIAFNNFKVNDGTVVCPQ